MRKAGAIILTVLLAAALSACDKKKGGSNGGSASTPEKDCHWDWQRNGYVDSNGRTCTPTEDNQYNSSYCHNYVYDHSTNTWRDQSGKKVNCQQGFIDHNNFNPYTYTSGSGGYQSGCSVYGYGWQPVYFGYSLVCVNYSYMQNSGYGSYGYGGGGGGGSYGNYYGGGGYYGGYPSTCRVGVNCGGASAGLWFGGTIGISL